VPFLI